jgi:hypothetical protein
VIDLQALFLLRRHVAACPERRIGVGKPRFGPFHASDPEVEQLHVIERLPLLALEQLEEDVAGLDVAMHDACRVHRAQGVAHLQGHGQQDARRQRSHPM